MTEKKTKKQSTAEHNHSVKSTCKMCGSNDTITTWIQKPPYDKPHWKKTGYVCKRCKFWDDRKV